jgi:hypothetical protein
MNKRSKGGYYGLFWGLGVVLALVSCQKWKDQKGADPGLTSYYCNDPVAVNYNWGFPGMPDSTVCYYPSDVFTGTFSFVDSVLLPDNTLSGIQSGMFQITADSREKFTIAGICAGNMLHFTANRYGLATADTLIANGAGQLMCREQDTLVGQITQSAPDTLFFNFTVLSDTGTTYHLGTAYKQ